MTYELDEILNSFAMSDGVDFDEAKQAIQALIDQAYKKGYLDGGIDVINGRSTPLKVKYMSKKEIAELSNKDNL